MADLFVLQADSGENDSWAAIDDNTVLHARVVDVRKIVKPFNDNITGLPVEKVQFTFEVTEDGKFLGRRIKGETSTHFVANPGCRMYAWVQEILGVEIPEGFRFNTDAVIGSDCRVRVSKKVTIRRDGKGEWVDN